MNSAFLYRQATGFHKQGNLDQAEKLYVQIIQRGQDTFSARHALGVLRSQQGRAQEAVQLIGSALQINPDDAQALSNYGLALHVLGHLDEALTSFDRALAVMPSLEDAWVNRGIALNALKRWDEALASFDHALAIRVDFDALRNRGDALWALGRFAESLESYDRALEIRPGDAVVLSNRANVLRGLRRYDEALECYRNVLAIDPGNAEMRRNYCYVLLESDRIEEGLAAFQRWAALSHGGRAGQPQRDEPPHKMRHDKEQLDYLLTVAAKGGAAKGGEIAQSEFGAKLMTPTVNAAMAEDVAERWRLSNQQLVVIDNLLSAEALDALRLFCLRSKIWHRTYAGGYLGALPEHGFACPLLGQIAQELRQVFPTIFGTHELTGLWAFKYDSALEGIDIHADEAAVNVNMWITPDDANLDSQSGGLVVWDLAAPLDWDFEKFNRDAAAARDFLSSNGAKSTTIPYRANRAVIFDSDLFHKTDKIVFKEGYLNRRINITLLYGKRDSLKKSPAVKKAKLAT